MMKIKIINEKPNTKQPFELICVGQGFRTENAKYNVKTNENKTFNTLYWDEGLGYWSSCGMDMKEMVQPIETEIVFNEGSIQC